jgi:hypothetical protein
MKTIVKGLLVFVCVALYSCAPTLRVPEAPTYEGPVDIEVLKDRRVLKNIRTLRSEVKVKFKRGKKSLGSFKGALLFEHPESMRLRVYSPLGAGGVDLVHLNGLLQIFIPEQGVLYEGQSPATKTELGYYMENKDSHYKLFALKTEEWGTSIYASYSYNKRTLLNKKITMYKEGESFVVMRFRDFIDGVPMRAKLDLFNGYVMYIDLIQPEIDIDISPELFELYGHGELTVLPLERILTEGR